MAPFRNFLSRKSTAPPNGGEVTASDTNASSHLSLDSHASTPMSIRQSTDNNEPPEYKLSVVDANGIYHPPSPPEKASIWRKYPGSPKSSHSHHRDLVDENEPFSISRESFDSYRRSFDISARSPICYSDAMPSRTSLDSRVSRMTSLSSAGLRKQPETMEEEQFEEVGLDDEEVKPKRKSIFSRFGDFTTTSDSPSTSSTSKTSSLGFHIPGRKRGQSNVGSELGTFQGPPETDVRDA
ncbi:hypothetical protein BO70DRAFT_379902 [Aspergillus heteromorphus CBS 117.55]|uniref:Uncharacterized protein n=1 Tax=Aspergillus heteromorphus CBS 117.55 TaxID=1448321 RepID=A0A317WCQ9_9EURO|nr:uncharacterized protein BO70DRAFT_379902 [Aspergillus heteromorphus CBS 117.55]PWY81950.1 hypothetical protein BO70DRAFT_379902 [Aspergillus heteromorphus CBS 117.55]